MEYIHHIWNALILVYVLVRDLCAQFNRPSHFVSVIPIYPANACSPGELVHKQDVD